MVWDLPFWTALNSSFKAHLLYCLQVYTDSTLIIYLILPNTKSRIILISIGLLRLEEQLAPAQQSTTGSAFLLQTSLLLCRITSETFC